MAGVLKNAWSMVDSELVHRVDHPDGVPVTHAVVFGLGTYPYGRDISTSASLVDLSSPIETARAIANWLIESYDNPLRPLASVSLVVSAPAPFVYRNPVTGIDYVVPIGTTDDFENSVSAWSERAGSNAENGSIFYYCGHGLSAGVRDCMLSRSFGQKPNKHLDGVFERSALVNAMRSLGPKHQLFVFDTCRNESPELLENGTSLPSLLDARPGAVSAGEVQQCRLLATAEGQQAFGETEGISLFSKAFLAACRSAGSKVHREWWVNATSLLQHTDRFMSGQRPQLEGPAMEICRIGPTLVVPVVVCCDPDDHIYKVKMEMRSVAGSSHAFDGSAEVEANHWLVDLEIGLYSFVATACVAGEFASIEGQQVLVIPPFTDIVVDVVLGTVN